MTPPSPYHKRVVACATLQTAVSFVTVTALWLAARGSVGWPPPHCREGFRHGSASGLRACFPSHRPLLAGFHIGNTQPKRFLAHLLRHAVEAGAVRLRSRGGPNLPLSTDTATTEAGTTPTACPLPDTGQRTGGRACTGQRPPPGTHRRAAVPVLLSRVHGRGASQVQARCRVPVRVGAGQ